MYINQCIHLPQRPIAFALKAVTHPGMPIESYMGRARLEDTEHPFAMHSVRSAAVSITLLAIMSFVCPIVYTERALPATKCMKANLVYYYPPTLLI